MSRRPLVVYTVGHSTLPLADFIRILAHNEIAALADVRSSPYSRFNPQFNKEGLGDELSIRNILYVFLGNELGARSEDPSCYKDGQVQFDRLAATTAFKSGIQRIKKGAARYRIALMCAERDPLECHRTILVARELEKNDIEIRHMLSSGNIESHEDAMDRLIGMHGLDNGDLFRSREEIKNEAYDKQAKVVAYTRPSEVVETLRTADGQG